MPASPTPEGEVKTRREFVFSNLQQSGSNRINWSTLMDRIYNQSAQTERPFSRTQIVMLPSIDDAFDCGADYVEDPQSEMKDAEAQQPIPDLPGQVPSTENQQSAAESKVASASIHSFHAPAGPAPQPQQMDAGPNTVTKLNDQQVTAKPSFLSRLRCGC